MAIVFEELGNELSFLKAYSVNGYCSFDIELKGKIILLVYLTFIKSDLRYSYAVQFLKTK